VGHKAIFHQKLCSQQVHIVLQLLNSSSDFHIDNHNHKDHIRICYLYTRQSYSDNLVVNNQSLHNHHCFYTEHTYCPHNKVCRMDSQHLYSIHNRFRFSIHHRNIYHYQLPIFLVHRLHNKTVHLYFLPNELHYRRCTNNNSGYNHRFSNYGLVHHHRLLVSNKCRYIYTLFRHIISCRTRWIVNMYKRRTHNRGCFFYIDRLPST